MPFTGNPHIENFNIEDTVFFLSAFTICCIAFESAPTYVLQMFKAGVNRNSSLQNTAEALPHQQRAKSWFMVLYILSTSYMLMLFNVTFHWVFPWAGTWLQWQFFIVIVLVLIVLRRIAARLFFIAINQNTALLKDVYSSQKIFYITLAISQSLLVVYYNIQAQNIQFLINTILFFAVIMVLQHTVQIIKSLWASRALSFFQFFSYICIVEVFPLATGIKLLLVFI